MHDHFRVLAVHQALFHKKLFEAKTPLSADQAAALADGLTHDGLWLTKFPLLFVPTYGVERLDAWSKRRQTAPLDLDETQELRRLVDADLVRFALKLTENDLGARVEIFWGGRAMNKPLWQYLAGWFERGAALRGRLSSSPALTLFETVFA